MSLYVRLAAAFLMFSSAVWAQSIYGVIYGSITDPSSAVIRAAIVEARNAETGATRAAKTSAEGLFRFVNLDSGTYTISAKAPRVCYCGEKGRCTHSARSGSGRPPTAGGRSRGDDCGGRGGRSGGDLAAYTFGYQVGSHVELAGAEFPCQ